MNKLLLQSIRDYYANLDNSAHCILYMQRPLSEHIHIFNEVCVHSIVDIERPQTNNDLDISVAKLRDFLDHNFHDKTWACHDVHFHINFTHYLGCPMTCVNEIVETIDRIMVERFRN